MPVQVVFTGILPDWWGADECLAEGGPEALRELLNEDLPAAIGMMNYACWKVAKETPE